MASTETQERRNDGTQEQKTAKRERIENPKRRITQTRNARKKIKNK